MIRTKILPIGDMLEIGPCVCSDWAVNQGALQSKILKDEKGRFYSSVASATPIIRKTLWSSTGEINESISEVLGVAPDGTWTTLRANSGGCNTSYRPALATPFKLNGQKDTIFIDEYALPLKKDSNGKTYFELGAYPQKIASDEEHKMLNAQPLNVIKTGNVYYCRYDKKAEEVQLDNKRYVRSDDGIWHVVNLIRWTVDGNKIYAE